MGKPFLDFDAIKSRADIVSVVERYGVKLRKVKESQYTAKCPLPSHTNEKEASSFGVNTAKNVFKCFSDSCRKAGNGSQGNVLDFIRLMDRCNAYDAALKLNGWFPPINPGDFEEPAIFPKHKLAEHARNRGNQNAPHEAGRNGQQRVESSTKTQQSGIASNPTPPAPEVNRPLAFRLKDVNPVHPMIQERHISPETAHDFGAGFFAGKGSMAGRIVFPMYEDGELIGYAGRTTLPITEENPKWKMPKGLVKSFLYGLEHCEPNEPLILVEACWEVLSFCEQGYQAAALLGTTLTPQQEKRLEPFKTIWLMLDDDEAGRAATEKIAARLKGKHNVLKAKLRE